MEVPSRAVWACWDSLYRASSRGLRGAVIYRKVSLGSQSEAGERFAERMLSISQTCRLQEALALRLPGRGAHRLLAGKPRTLSGLSEVGEGEGEGEGAPAGPGG